MSTVTLADVELIVTQRVADLERRLDPRAYTVRQVADRLSLSQSYVRDLIASGALPSILIGSARRVRADDLAAFLAERAPAEPGANRNGAYRAQSGSTLVVGDLMREAYGGPS